MVEPGPFKEALEPGSPGKKPRAVYRARVVKGRLPGGGGPGRMGQELRATKGQGLGRPAWASAVKAGFLEEVEEEEDDTWWPILAGIKLWLKLAGIRLRP